MKTIERLKNEIHEPDRSLLVQTRDLFSEWELLNKAYGLSEKGQKIFDNYLSSAIYNVGMASISPEKEKEHYTKKLNSIYSDVDVMEQSVMHHLKSKADGTGYNLYHKKLEKWLMSAGLITNQASVEKSLKELLTEVMGIFNESLTEETWQKCLSVYNEAQETGKLNRKALEKALWIVLSQSSDKVLEFSYKNVIVESIMVNAFEKTL